MNAKQINAMFDYDCMTKDLYHGELSYGSTTYITALSLHHQHRRP